MKIEASKVLKLVLQALQDIQIQKLLVLTNQLRKQPLNRELPYRAQWLIVILSTIQLVDLSLHHGIDL